MKLGVASPRVLFRKTLCAFLTGAGIFDSIIELDNVMDLASRSDKSQPLVLILHASDAPAGIESLNQLCYLLPEARVLFLADEPDEELGVQVLEAGAWGCMSTGESPEVLVKAVSKVAAGERWFAHRVTDTVIDRFMAGRRISPTITDSLTPREWEVLALIAQGYSDKEVASSLFISRETARSHVKSIYKKLQVSTRRAAAVCYFKHVRNKSGPSNVPPEAIGIVDIV